jgi:hypothetical protein
MHPFHTGILWYQQTSGALLCGLSQARSICARDTVGRSISVLDLHHSRQYFIPACSSLDPCFGRVVLCLCVSLSFSRMLRYHPPQSPSDQGCTHTHGQGSLGFFSATSCTHRHCTPQAHLVWLWPTHARGAKSPPLTADRCPSGICLKVYGANHN